ncbi:MAG TPA: cysteine desulfurase [Herpetosiphon sp.]|uniref:Cysteine desulfurase n=1 Tax=Herpetosiphon aurantiacus (strain ATCC 23779 / DSM 785 / 114-95) TaxID=316274 RepID=A9AUE1_HERA2|nr:cysteine desulfurase [Herpetosiphon sp.]ABX03060.1 cysteine desulfurase, SufS subfamily [Herpetosiphon aurantiacus DSM 785]HBW50837.1 cysteine desulfurase [Herpetosiphon sp.]
MSVQTTLDIQAIREQFPLLDQSINGHRLAYLDSTATAQKPLAVLDAMDRYYRTINANVHRGVYQISEAATEAYEGTRRTIGRFIGAKSTKEIIFTRNATEAINLVAQSWGRANLQAGDRILLTVSEHHSNLVPWQLLAAQTGVELDFIELDDQGRLDLSHLDQLLTERTKLVAMTHMSNVLGTINPVERVIAAAKQVGALVLLDGAQSVPHIPVNVQALGCDFLAFSGHKMCGPTGIGVLWARRELLEAMPPFMGGGDMIKRVGLRESSWNDLPWKFEAGTPAIAEAIGLGAAIDFLNELGMQAIHERERQLTHYAWDKLSAIDGLTIFGPPAAERGGLLSFTLAGVHAHDVAAILDTQGIAVRAGHHCTHPLHDIFGVPATVRASFYLYTLEEEIDRLAEALVLARDTFQL